MTLSHGQTWGRRKESGERRTGLTSRKAKIQNERVTKMPRLSMDKPVEKGSPAAGLESSGRGRSMPAIPLSRVLRNAGRPWRPGPL